MIVGCDRLVGEIESLLTLSEPSSRRLSASGGGIRRGQAQMLVGCWHRHSAPGGSRDEALPNQEGLGDALDGFRFLPHGNRER